MKKYSEQEMLEFGDWCRQGLTNMEYSDLYHAGNLFNEYQKRKNTITIDSK